MDYKIKLIVFAKAPIPGYAKTRLARQVGNDEAALLHESLTVHCVKSVVSSHRYTTSIGCTPEITHPFFSQLEKNHDVTLFQQQGHDLGERMANTMRSALLETDLAIIIGTDCPLITVSVVETIIEKVKNHDVAIIPAEDGGYVLLALKQMHDSLFTDIQWGSNQVYKQTMVKFRKLGWSCYIHETLWDIDRPEDMKKLNGIKLLS